MYIWLSSQALLQRREDFPFCGSTSYILLIYSRAILSFAWLTGYATRPVLLSYTVHTDSLNAHNNNDNSLYLING